MFSFEKEKGVVDDDVTRTAEDANDRETSHKTLTQ